MVNGQMGHHSRLLGHRFHRATCFGSRGPRGQEPPWDVIAEVSELLIEMKALKTCGNLAGVSSFAYSICPLRM